MSSWLETGSYRGRQAGARADWRRHSVRLGLALALVAGLSLAVSSSVANAFTLPVTGPPNAPRMVFDNQMKVVQVCLPVTNPAAGQSLLYGQRFTDGPVGPSTPAIVLVHGIASSTQAWDVSPTWSAARALASAGYVVFSYDRLGYGQSSYYDHPGGGFTLTTAAHRSMLHNVVDDVKTSGYRITANGDCSGASTPGNTKSTSVIVIGHSAGGWTVAGYPGEYHDVAAMIEADISGSAGGSASSPLGGSLSGGGFTPDPSHPDYFEFFQTPQDCLDFNTYTPGVVQYAAQIVCTAPFPDSPYGDILDLPAMYAQNDAYIAMIGPSIPVLLTSGENDTTDPPSSAVADFDYYKTHCGCDVSQLLLPNTAHLFMVHTSLPTWVDYVVNWLTSHGLAGTPVVPGTQRCPKPTGHLAGASLGPLRLGWTRAHARRTLQRFGVTSNNMDNFCLFAGSGIRVGYPSVKLSRRLSARLRARIAGRIILALTANPFYALDGARPGMRVAAVARRLGARRPFHIGSNDWYVIGGKASHGVLKVRGGIIQEVGIASLRPTQGRAAQRRLLNSFTAP
jgi:pimeloyl-ACP methyl ester carboxylesterase